VIYQDFLQQETHSGRRKGAQLKGDRVQPAKDWTLYASGDEPGDVPRNDANGQYDTKIIEA